MASTQKKTIVVVGATGNQGSSVVNAFLSLPHWHIRCLTRNPSSPAGQKLKSLGTEVTYCDLSDSASLARAFDSAHAIFANTDFWAVYRDPKTPARAAEANITSSELAFNVEVSHGMNIANAAAGVPTLERFIYSALPSMKKASHGKYPNSYHWESKATVIQYIEDSLPLLAAKMSLIYLGSYASNNFLQPKWNEEKQKYLFVMPMKPETVVPVIDAAGSTGTFVRALVEDEDPGTKLLAYNSSLTMSEITKIWSRVLGLDTDYVEVTVQAVQEQSGLPLEILDGPAYMSEFGYSYGITGLVEPAQLTKEIHTNSYEDWLRSKDWKEILAQRTA